MRFELDVDVRVAGVDLAFDTRNLEAVGVHGNRVATGPGRRECEASFVIGQRGDVRDRSGRGLDRDSGRRYRTGV